MTRITMLRRAVVVALLAMWAVSLLVCAAPRDQFAQETGLDADLVNLVTVDVGGTELTIVFVYINERTFQSRISADLAVQLQPYLGQNAVYINPSIDAVVTSFGFDPGLLSVSQAGVGSLPPWEAWDEITPGFLSGAFQVNPSGPAQGSGSEGVVILNDLIDPSQPFELIYAGQRAGFSIGTSAPVGVQSSTGAPTAAVQSHEPIDVAPLGTLNSVEELLLHDDFSAEAMAAVFELDPALVRTMIVTPRGNELRLFLVRLEGSVRSSLLGDELIASIEEVISTGAILVWAVASEGADFSPWNFYIRQAGTNFVFFSTASFVELTDGFLRLEQIPADHVAAGVIRLPRSADPAVAFSLYYGTSGVDFP